MVSAQQEWASGLRSWAIPQQILDSVEESPWALPPEAFAESARLALELPPTPTHRLALESLPDSGVVLDVGSGAGAASLPLAPPAGRIVAVDQSPAMLRELLDLAGSSVKVTAVEGIWPAAAALVEPADVVICANVAYNVEALDEFVLALTEKARHRVVLELTAKHPQQPLNWLWQHFWGLERPEVPTAETAAAVVRETLGVKAETVRWAGRAPLTDRLDDRGLAWIRRRLCLPQVKEAELAALLRSHEPAPVGDLVTIAWPGRA
jgi:2-polyprenyl-3-methyl-5-hydroxy-6-metoxy-1,4-benzoquinol methylase